MTLIDLVVLAVVALAALRGWRRGGTGLVLRVAGAVAGLLLGGVVARWLTPALDVSGTGLAIACAVVGALVGWGLGRRLGETLARRGDGGPRRPGLPDRALGVVAHAALALMLCLLAGDLVALTGPSSLEAAAERSAVLGVAADRLPTPLALWPTATGTPSALDDGSTR